MASPGARPRPLGDTLSNGTTVAFAAASSGSLAIVNAAVGPYNGRVYWQAKQVQVCDPKPPVCRPLPAPTSTVTVDPSWSPGGTTLAFAEAPSVASSDLFDQSAVAGWYGAHQLWLYDAAQRTLRKVGAARGATVPQWSGDGKALLYVAQDGLWLLPGLTESPVEIASPLFQKDKWPSYYAQIDWLGQFAWSPV